MVVEILYFKIYRFRKFRSWKNVQIQCIYTHATQKTAKVLGTGSKGTHINVNKSGFVPFDELLQRFETCWNIHAYTHRVVGSWQLWLQDLQVNSPPGHHTWARCCWMVARLSSSSPFDGHTPILDEQTTTKAKTNSFPTNPFKTKKDIWAKVKTEQRKAKSSYEPVCLFNLPSAPATRPQSASPSRTTRYPHPAGARCSSPYMGFSFQPP